MLVGLSIGMHAVHGTVHIKLFGYGLSWTNGVEEEMWQQVALQCGLLEAMVFMDHGEGHVI